MAKIYLPTEYVNKPCKIINNGYIRVYNTTNYNQTNTVYDIYINQDYMVKKNTASYSSSTVCDTSNEYTDDYYYRLDFSNSLVVLLIMSIFVAYIPIRIFFRLFKRGKL